MVKVVIPVHIENSDLAFLWEKMDMLLAHSCQITYLWQALD
jgi:hypothetical protein